MSSTRRPDAAPPPPPPAARPVMIVDLAKRFGGADVRVLQIATALRGRTPLTVATLAGSPLERRLAEQGLPYLPLTRRRGDPRIVLDLARALRRGRYHAIDAHNPQSQLWSLAAGLVARVPVRIVTVHSQYLAEHDGGPRGRAYELVLKLNRALGARFVTVSPPTEAYVRALGVPPARVSLVANAVAPAVPDPRGRSEVLGGWPEDSFVVGVIARLEPVKGIHDLIEALAITARRQPRLRCLVVGDGRSRAALEDQVRDAGLSDRVRFTGFRDDVGLLLSGLDLFCLPSRSEGLPFALLEACAHRLPLLVTAVGGMAALLEDGVTAAMVPPADPPSLAAALERLAASPDEMAAMGDRAHRLVRQGFSLEAMVAATLEAYGGEAPTPIRGTPSPSGT